MNNSTEVNNSFSDAFILIFSCTLFSLYEYVRDKFESLKKWFARAPSEAPSLNGRVTDMTIKMSPLEIGHDKEVEEKFFDALEEQPLSDEERILNYLKKGCVAVVATAVVTASSALLYRYMNPLGS